MDEASQRECAHCGVLGASFYANDGSSVCDTCFSYDQITSGELRAAQLSAGLPLEEDAETFLRHALRKGRFELAFTLLLGAVSLVLLHYGRHEAVALACGIVTTALTVLSTFHAIGMLRFARQDAPAVYRHVSQRPPPHFVEHPTFAGV